MNFPLPGFQSPNAPKAEDRVEAQPSGRVEFKFMDDIPLDQPMPKFDIYISIERGRVVVPLAITHSDKCVYEKVDEERNLKAYWFRLLPQEDLIILPGTYRVRFLVNDEEVTSKSLTVLNHPAFP